MATDDIKNAEKLLLEKYLAERSHLDQLIAGLQKRLGIAQTSEASPLIPPDLSTIVQKGEFSGMSRPQAATALLRKVNRSLSTNEIFELLKESGLDMSGKNAFTALYTALSRNSDVRKVAPNTWGLKEWSSQPMGVKKSDPAVDEDDAAIPFPGPDVDDDDVPW